MLQRSFVSPFCDPAGDWLVLGDLLIIFINLFGITYEGAICCLISELANILG